MNTHDLLSQLGPIAVAARDTKPRTTKRPAYAYAASLLKRIAGAPLVTEDAVQSCVGDYLSRLCERERGSFSGDNYYGVAIDAMTSLGYTRDVNGDFVKVPR